MFSNPNSKIFRRDYLQKTHDFYDKHGGKTVTLARFLPILRTFAPFVAGIAKMPYPRFFGFSVFGTVLWVGGLVTLGYFFGNVPFIKKNLSLLVVFIILLSLVPMIIGVVPQPLWPQFHRSQAAVTCPMWSLSAWRRRRLLAKHPIADETWQRVRHHLTFLDGITAGARPVAAGSLRGVPQPKNTSPPCPASNCTRNSACCSPPRHSCR